jgi:hypothetical protein
MTREVPLHSSSYLIWTSLHYYNSGVSPLNNAHLHRIKNKDHEKIRDGREESGQLKTKCICKKSEDKKQHHNFAVAC